MKRLAYFITYPLLWLLSLLPFPWLYLKSSATFYLVYYVVGYRKKVVKGNLRLVFPEKSEAAISQIAKQFYRHLCDVVFETIKSLTISEQALRKRFAFKNLEVLEKLHQEGKSVLLMCGHYASWEWSGILAKQMPFKGYAVYKKLDNPYFDRLVKKIRGKYGASIINNKQIAKVLYKSFKQGEQSLTLILSDQTPKPWAYKEKQSFMGIDVPVFVGTEELAKLLDFAAVYLKIEKVKRGHYEATFVPLAAHPKEVPDYQITRRFLDEIEKQIRDQPQYYLWSHKRWKHRHHNSNQEESNKAS
ncbi:MAG: lysophospholipid acyltransferase family protein [Flavobacteriaceae bacterium]